MKITTLLLLAIGLGICSMSCSPRDEDRAKREAREAARQIEAGAKKASSEIDRDLKKTRDKVNEKLDEHR